MKNLPTKSLNLPAAQDFTNMQSVDEIDDRTTKVTTSDIAKEDVASAVRDGRLSIRSADLAPRVIEELAKKFSPDIIVNKIAECLEATKTMAVGGRPYDTPDYKTRLDALKLVMQYQVGMPVARSEVVTHNVDTMQTLESKMQNSPALRRAVGRMLDKAKADDGEVINVSTDSRPLSESEMIEAEKVLQDSPPPEETPVQTEVRTRNMSEFLKARGKMDINEKYSR